MLSIHFYKSIGILTCIAVTGLVSGCQEASKTDSPQPASVEVDQQGVIDALNSMGTYALRASARREDISQCRSDIQIFDSVGGDLLLHASEKTRQRIEDSSSLIADYHRHSAREAAMIMSQARIDTDMVISILDRNNPHLGNGEQVEIEHVVTVVRNLLSDPHKDSGGDEALAYESLKSLFH